MDDRISALAQLDLRSRDIFQSLVECYLDSGAPVGSRSISKLLPHSLSPASVRNVMSDLEALGLIYAPHTSAGRLPTETGLRLFVDGMMQIGDLGDEERTRIESQISTSNRDRNIEDVVLTFSNDPSQQVSGK